MRGTKIAVRPTNGLPLRKQISAKRALPAEVRDGVDPAAVGERVGVQPGRRGEDEHQHDHRRAEHRGDDGLPALVLPVDVLEVEDERELVEHERGAGAEGDRGEVDDRGARVGRERDQAADEDEHEPGNHVVDVRVAEPAAPPAVRRASRVYSRVSAKESRNERSSSSRGSLPAW